MPVKSVVTDHTGIFLRRAKCQDCVRCQGRVGCCDCVDRESVCSDAYIHSSVI